MTDEEIHNIYLHMSGKAEGLVEATGKADFPVLFARAILEYEGMTKDMQNMASKSTYKEQLKTKDEPVSDKLERLLWEFIDLKAMHPNHNPDPRTWPHVFAYAPKPNHLVAWGMEKDGVILDVICPEEHEREEGEYTIPLYTTPQREYEQGFIDGMQKQMQSSVDKAVNSMGKREWVGLTDEEKAQFVVAYYPSNWDRKTAVSLMNDYEKYLKERNT